MVGPEKDETAASPAPWRSQVVFSGERMVPEMVDHGNLIYHLRRYEFAKGFASGKRVLDAGCGIGYGSEMLASAAQSVAAVDYCSDAVLYAQQHHSRPNLRYTAADATALCFEDCSFDVVVSLEVFEHISNYEAYLAETYRVLKPGGVFILSTPNQVVDQIHMKAIRVQYEYHVNMASLSRLKGLLRPMYRRVQIYGLRRRGNPIYTVLRGLDLFNLRLRLLPPSQRDRVNGVFGTPSVPSLSVSDVVVSRWQVEQANWVIATGVKPFT